jgi:diguanylate cyclase (GGDEF)-like protein
MQLSNPLFNKKFFLWPLVRFVVNYAKPLIFSCFFLLVVIYSQGGDISILIAALSTFLAAVLYAQNIHLSMEVHQDKLTGLDNKNSLSVHLEQEISRVDRNGGYLTLLFFDIDNFKKINDTYGHKTGDGVLIEVARRLMAKMRNYDKLIRYGGDEFCVICPQLKSEADSVRIQKKLHATLHFSHRLKNKEIFIETSLGMATYPSDTENIHDLITIADQRMYEQKKRRKLARVSPVLVNE